MLATRFPSDFDPAKDAEGSPVNRESFEENYRKYDWTWSSGLVRHSCIAPNGGTHTFWHDPTTGQTYQARWAVERGIPPAPRAARTPSRARPLPSGHAAYARSRSPRR